MQEPDGRVNPLHPRIRSSRIRMHELERFLNCVPDAQPASEGPQTAPPESSTGHPDSWMSETGLAGAAITHKAVRAARQQQMMLDLLDIGKSFPPAPGSLRGSGAAPMPAPIVNSAEATPMASPAPASSDRLKPGAVLMLTPCTLPRTTLMKYV